MTSFLLVGAGGAIGAMGRYGLALVIAQVWRTAFPLATLVINVTGSLAMGLLIGLLARSLPAWSEEIRLFLAVGILGGYTTFSAFSLDAITLIERGEWWPAIAYIVLSVVLSIVGLWLGLVLTRGPA
jgi:fluoride exporter